MTREPAPASGSVSDEPRPTSGGAGLADAAGVETFAPRRGIASGPARLVSPRSRFDLESRAAALAVLARPRRHSHG